MSAEVTVEELLAKVKEMTEKAAELKATAEKMQKQKAIEDARYKGLVGFEGATNGIAFELTDAPIIVGRLTIQERDLSEWQTTGEFLFRAESDAATFIDAIEVLLLLRRSLGQVPVFYSGPRYMICLENKVLQREGAGSPYTNRPLFRVGDYSISVKKYGVPNGTIASSNCAIGGYFESSEAAVNAITKIGSERVAKAMMYFGGIK